MTRNVTTGLSRVLGAVVALGVTAPAAFAQDGPFVINALQAPATLDPAFSCDIVDNGYISPLYAPLVTYARSTIEGTPDGVTVTREDDSQVVANLAESWSVSDDGKTYTFQIREGAMFASGAAIDGAAVAASLTRAWQSGGCGTYFMEAGNFGNTASIEGDGQTVTITLNNPEPLLIHALTQPNLGIVDVAAADAAGGNDWMATNSAGSGPYVLSSYQPGVRATYAANPNYFGDAPRESEVVLNFVADASALLLQARNGEAHVTLGMPRQMLAQAETNMNVVAVPAPRWQLLGLPTRVAPFDNATFRQALSYAVPYEAILSSVAQGYGASFFGPFPPTFGAYNAELGGARAFDMARAQELMAQSGVTGPVELTLTVREGSADQERMATIIQGAWGALGVNVTISKLSASAYAEQIGAAEKTTAILRFDGPSVADPAWLLSYDMRCQSPYNMSNYCSETAEGLLNDAMAIPDMGARQGLWDQIAQVWVEDAPRIPLYAETYTVVLDPSVTAWDFAQDGPFEIQHWGR